MLAPVRLTMAEFVDLVENNPDKHFKFTAEGEVIEVSPKRLHGWIQTTVAYFFRGYISALPGYEVLTEVAHQLGDWPCRPDVSIDKAGDEEIPTIAPLVAVEIKSESNSYTDLREKARKYLEHGTKMVLLMYSGKRIIEVHQPGVDIQLLTAEDTLSGGDVLPGFSVEVAQFFPEPE